MEGMFVELYWKAVSLWVWFGDDSAAGDESSHGAMLMREFVGADLLSMVPGETSESCRSSLPFNRQYPYRFSECDTSFLGARKELCKTTT